MIAFQRKAELLRKKNAENERKRKFKSRVGFKLYLIHDYAFDLLIRGVLR